MNLSEPITSLQVVTIVTHLHYKRLRLTIFLFPYELVTDTSLNQREHFWIYKSQTTKYSCSPPALCFFYFLFLKINLICLCIPVVCGCCCCVHDECFGLGIDIFWAPACVQVLKIGGASQVEYSPLTLSGSFPQGPCWNTFIKDPVNSNKPYFTA